VLINRDPGQPNSIVLLDERSGRLAPLADLIKIYDREIYMPEISPDGEWIVVPLGEQVDPTLQPGQSGNISSLYLAPSNQLASGRVVAGEGIAGWASSPVRVFIKQRTATGIALSSLQLPGGQLTPLFSSPDEAWRVTVQATSRMTFAAVGGQVSAYLPDGERLASVDLYQPVMLSALSPARGLFSGYTTRALGEGQCAFMPALFLWDIR
jgi:hypothetical protein